MRGGLGFRVWGLGFARRLTSDDVISPGHDCLPGGGHERPGEEAGVDALGLPHVHPISNAQPEDAGPAVIPWFRF